SAPKRFVTPSRMISDNAPLIYLDLRVAYDPREPGIAARLESKGEGTWNRASGSFSRQGPAWPRWRRCRARWRRRRPDGSRARAAGRWAARVARTETDATLAVIADRHAGRPPNSPSDIVCKSEGAIGFTDPPFGVLGNYEGHVAKPELPTNVYRWDPKTQKFA